MRTEVVADWSRWLGAEPPEARDVYFDPAYVALHREGRPEAIVVTDGEHRLIVSGLVTPIPGVERSLADLQSPNGYGGPLVTPGAPPAFLAEAWSAWSEAACAAGVVAALFRLHPLLENRAALPAGAAIVADRATVYVALTEGLAAAWDGAESRHRNMVNRGRREGTQPRWNADEDWAAFATLYSAAMDRLSAPARLRFDVEYFQRLRVLDGAELVAVRDGGGLVAAQVFLWGPCWGHYHLAARRPDAPNYVMSLLLQHGLERAAARGLRGLHLGGGATPSPDDGVLRFKRSLGGAELRFELGLVISDVARYRELVQVWERREGRPPNWLLGYRQPHAAPGS